MNRKVKREPSLKCVEHSSKQRLDLKIVYRQIDTVKLDPANPRRHSKKQVRQIANSIEAFGLVTPILIDRNDNVIAGHGRLLACRLLGITEVPTLCLDHLTSAQARAFMIADNRLTEIATWDDRLLAQQLKDLSLIGLDFNIEDTGFEMGEIDLRIASLEDPPEATDDPADVLPDVPAGPVVSKMGDLWILSRHRVLCGNALDAAVFATLMGEERTPMVFTDPPYNVPIDGHASGLGAVHHRPFPMASGEMDSIEFTSFLSGALRNVAAFSIDGSLHYICMDWRHAEELLAAGRGVYGELKNLCVWNKTNAGMGSFYRSKHELVFVWKSGTAAHINNFELGQHGRSRTNVWDYAGISSMHAGRLEELAMHPTVKPVAMVADAIKDCSRRGALVLDPFCGSGTILLAAERTGRKARAIEIDPTYVDVGVRRWQSYTGKAAILASSGETFEMIEEQRAAKPAAA